MRESKLPEVTIGDIEGAQTERHTENSISQGAADAAIPENVDVKSSMVEVERDYSEED